MKLFNWFKEKEVEVIPEVKHSDAELKILRFLRDIAIDDIKQFTPRYAPKAYTLIHNDIQFVITPYSVRITGCDGISDTNHLFKFIEACDEARLKQASDLKLQQIAENLK